LYRPRGLGYQILAVFGALIAMLPASRAVSLLLGGLSANAETFLFLPLLLIFMLGYGLWLTRLQAIAFHFLGKVLIRAFFNLIVRKRKPENPDNLLPSAEKFEEMAVRAQQAASSFFAVSIPIAVAGGLAALLFESPAAAWLRLTVVAGMCLLWGYGLTWLGRRGYLPLPEEG
jgi:hypothetical protein